MESLPDLLKRKREYFGYSTQVIAALIGVTHMSYFDLEAYENEYELLDIIHVVRIALLYECPISELLDAILQRDTTLEPGIIDLPMDIELNFPDRTIRFNRAGWDSNAAEVWFGSTVGLANMPLLALLDLCEEYELSLIPFLNSFATLIPRMRTVDNS